MRPEKTELEQYYSLSDISKALNISESTVRRRLKNGEIKGIKIGKVWRISRTSFREYLDNLDKSEGKEAHENYPSR